MSEMLIFIYHELNRFLGTTAGELLKTSLELLLLLFLLYMLISEYLRERKDQYKYLLYAILTFFLGRLFTAGLLAAVTFGGFPPSFISTPYQIIIGLIEVLGVVLTINAFMYPSLRRRLYIYRIALNLELLLTGFVFILLIIFYTWFGSTIPNIEFIIQAILQFLLILVILFLLVLLFFNPVTKDKFTFSAIAAFLIYLITPIIDLINILLYGFKNPFLIVIAHPFPLFAIILLTRAIYLRLVDKAMLKSKLTETTQKYEETKEISKLKDEFVSTVSHELKTPLTSIKLYLGILKNKKLDEEDKKKAISIMNNDVNYLTALINDILDLSKLESNKISIRPVKTKLRDLVEESTHEILASEKEIKIENKIPKDVYVRVDPGKFKQIIVNLFSNAVKFTDNKGKITLGYKSTRKEWRFYVKDTGEGIPKDKIPHLFDRFYQVQDYLTREKRGTGLGLAIVKKLVELHEGDIEVKSKINSGSTFTICIPINS